MRIWFDISNTPQVYFFKQIMLDLKKEGHEIIVTSRPLANTVELLDNEKIPHIIVGRHYGKPILSKIMGYPIRVIQLWKVLREMKIDLSVAQSSFHAPLVAWLLGSKSIYTNDNEHAIGNIPAFLFATSILLPEGFNVKNRLIEKYISSKLISYPGIKEGIYLSQKKFYRNTKLTEGSATRLSIYIRPEPSTAQYYTGKKNFLDEFIIGAKERFAITILPRDELQRKHYTQQKFRGVFIPKNILSFDEIVTNCSLFIGAGGSMTREMALVGVPTISVYQDQLLTVDRKLIENNMLMYKPDLTVKDVEHFVFSKNRHSNLLIEQGRIAYKLFINNIRHFN